MSEEIESTSEGIGSGTLVKRVSSGPEWIPSEEIGSGSLVKRVSRETE